jgi:hypothetical protein
MKKVICLLAILGMGYGLFAFDRSLNGSWGLIAGTEKMNLYGSILMDTLYSRSTLQQRIYLL